MNQKTAKLIRKFANSMGIDPKTDKSRYKAMKKAHGRAPAPEKARGTALMRKTLES